MYYMLVNDVEGVSTMSRAHAPGMMGLSAAKIENGCSLHQMVSETVEVVNRASKVNAPLHLRVAVLAVLFGARRREVDGVEGVVRMRDS